jgi:5-(carboxyamino)imidazole ribonucleotide mutase
MIRHRFGFPVASRRGGGFAVAAPEGRALLRAMAKPLVGIIMGSTSDWETMQHAAAQLEALGVPYEKRVVSAHRTPRLMVSYAESAERRGLKAIIAGAGGAAHLPGMTASLTSLPVLGVPVESHALKGMDSLLSIVQMPGGVPVGTFAIGKAGAINAALFAASIVALEDKHVRQAWRGFRAAQTAKVLKAKLPEAGAPRR